MRACTGALFGIALAGLCSYLLLGSAPDTVWLIAPMGASAVLLFAAPASPLAQPWSIMGGNMVAAVIGVTCAKLIGEPVMAAAFAVSSSIVAMFALRCLHPPGGAVALTVVLGGPAVHAMGYSFVVLPVGINSLLLLLTALFFNNATGRRYPHLVQNDYANKHETKDLAPTARIGITWWATMFRRRSIQNTILLSPMKSLTLAMIAPSLPA
jgi:CBS domain-containing membrane protein